MWFDYAPIGTQSVQCSIRIVENEKFDPYQYFLQNPGEELAGNLEEMVEERPHLDTLVAACKECMSACSLLQRVLPELPLTSAAAPDVHGMVYTLTSLEVALHQFIERELLHEAPGTRRRSDSGQRLQDALERTSRALKPAGLLSAFLAVLLEERSELRVGGAQRLGEEVEERRDAAGEEARLRRLAELVGPGMQTVGYSKTLLQSKYRQNIK